MVELRRIEPLPLGKLQAFIWAALALVRAVPMLFATVFEGPGSELWGEFSITSIVDMTGFYGLLLSPVVAGFWGLINGCIIALAYNWAAGQLGGVKITIVTASERDGASA